MPNTMFVVTGDCRIIRCATRQEVVSALRSAQASGDRFASVVGSDDWRTIEAEAGYTIGASEQECETSLDRIAAGGAQ